jgi:hypothetical protein
VRRVVRDRHREDVLVGEPAGLRRQQLRAERFAHPHEREPGRAQQVLHRAAGHHVGAERAHVELERTDRLVAVREHDRSGRVTEVRDRRHVVAVAGAERESGAADESRPRVDRRCEALDRDAAVGLRSDVHDLRAPQLLCVRDLADGRELVLADDDPVSVSRELERRTSALTPWETDVVTATSSGSACSRAGE